MSSASSVSHEIAAVLRTEILRHQYRPGERLPSERDLSARFNASRGAVREALSQLGQQGIIQIHPGGARVQPREAATLAILGPLLALDPVPDPELVDQFLEIFGVLTALTARRALLRAGKEHMIQLKERLVHLSQQPADFEAMEPDWRELLEYLASVDDNLVVRLIGNDLKAQFMQRMLQLGIKPKLKPSAGTELVKSLKYAVSRQDGELAARAFEKHFEHLRAAVREAILAQRSKDTRGNPT
jgi:DNA-binding FadR family transcriptional regulator